MQRMSERGVASGPIMHVVTALDRQWDVVAQRTKDIVRPRAQCHDRLARCDRPALGGQAPAESFLTGEARDLTQEAFGWSLPSESGPITAREAVVALGPWSDDVFRPLGYDIPLAVKCGYHMHYGARGNATLRHPLHDGDGGYMLVPMSKGIRLTTGVEFADRDAPPNPIQLARDEPL